MGGQIRKEFKRYEGENPTRELIRKRFEKGEKLLKVRCFVRGVCSCSRGGCGTRIQWEDSFELCEGFDSALSASDLIGGAIASEEECSAVEQRSGCGSAATV